MPGQTLHSDPSKFPLGNVRKQYRAMQVLGCGSFGCARLVEDTVTGDLLVVKTSFNDKHNYSVMERRLLESLRHRHIVRYYDGWEDPSLGTVNIALEYCEGGDLRHILRKRRASRMHFQESLIRQWLSELTLALHYCHAQHIVHRDLKAENVLLQQRSLKLADFGLSRTIETTTQFLTTRVGTPFSIPPEVMQSMPYNARADMWSLGVLLYELLTLRRPFTGNSVDEILRSVAHDEPPDVERESNFNYSPELYTLCRALLCKDPTKRPLTVDLLEASWARQFLPRDVGLFLRIGDKMRSREKAAWSRLVYDAEHAHSNVYEVMRTLNIREDATLDSDIIRVAQPGSYVEEIGRCADRGASMTEWLRLAGGGYCIHKVRDSRGREAKVLLRLPPYRIRRPGQLISDSPPDSEVTDSRTTNGTRCEAEVSAQLSTEYSSGRERLSALLAFLSTQGLRRDVLDELCAAHDVLAADPADDSAWTFHCLETLRPLRCAHCIRILRLVVHETLAEQQAQEADAAGSGAPDGDASDRG